MLQNTFLGIITSEILSITFADTSFNTTLNFNTTLLDQAVCEEVPNCTYHGEYISYCGCDSYWHCSWGTPYFFDCPVRRDWVTDLNETSLFDTNLNVCNWPSMQNLTCVIEVELRDQLGFTTEPITTTLETTTNLGITTEQETTMSTGTTADSGCSSALELAQINLAFYPGQDPNIFNFTSTYLDGAENQIFEIVENILVSYGVSELDKSDTNCDTSKSDPMDMLRNHGCWCSKPFTGVAFQGQVLDGIDLICKDYSKCSRCNSFEGCSGSENFTVTLVPASDSYRAFFRIFFIAKF